MFKKIKIEYFLKLLNYYKFNIQSHIIEIGGIILQRYYGK